MTKKQRRHGKDQNPDPTAWPQTEALYYLGNESQHPHLAGLVAGSQAPEEFILGWAAVGDLLVFQVPQGKRKTNVCFQPVAVVAPVAPRWPLPGHDAAAQLPGEDGPDLKPMPHSHAHSQRFCLQDGGLQSLRPPVLPRSHVEVQGGTPVGCRFCHNEPRVLSGVLQTEEPFLQALCSEHTPVHGLAEPRDGPPQRATGKGRAAHSAHSPDCVCVCASVCLCGRVRVLRGRRSGWALTRKPGGLGSRTEWGAYPRGPHSDFRPLSPLFLGWKAGGNSRTAYRAGAKGHGGCNAPCTMFSVSSYSLSPRQSWISTPRQHSIRHPRSPQRHLSLCAKIRDGAWLLSQIGTQGMHDCETKVTRPILTSASQSPL